MKPVRWGLIGCGDVARKRVARAIQDEPRSELVAACRRDEAKLRAFCDAFRVRRAENSAEPILTDPDIDAVYIATPVCDHLEQACLAAAHGKHVLVEKPMAMNVAECDRMIDACATGGVKLAVAYYRRFYPLVHRMEALLRDGAVGRPLSLSAVTATPLGLTEGDDTTWRVIGSHGGGGPLMDIGSHRLNLFLHLGGAIEEVKAICHRTVARYEVEDTALVLCRFASGVTGSLQCHFGSAVDPDEFSVWGTKGRLTARPLNGERLLIQTDTSEPATELHPPPDNLCGPLVADFVSAILEDREPWVNGVEGREVNAVIAQAYADSGVTFLP